MRLLASILAVAALTLCAPSGNTRCGAEGEPTLARARELYAKCAKDPYDSATEWRMLSRMPRHFKAILEDEFASGDKERVRKAELALYVSDAALEGVSATLLQAGSNSPTLATDAMWEPGVGEHRIASWLASSSKDLDRDRWLPIACADGATIDRLRTLSQDQNLDEKRRAGVLAALKNQLHVRGISNEKLDEQYAELKKRALARRDQLQAKAARFSSFEVLWSEEVKSTSYSALVCISPNGKKVLCRELRDRQRAHVLRDAMTGKELFCVADNNFAPGRFSPDGEHVLLASDMSPGSGWRVLDSRGATVAREPAEAAGVLPLCWINNEEIAFPVNTNAKLHFSNIKTGKTRSIELKDWNVKQVVLQMKVIAGTQKAFALTTTPTLYAKGVREIDLESGKAGRLFEYALSSPSSSAQIFAPLGDGNHLFMTDTFSGEVRSLDGSEDTVWFGGTNSFSIDFSLGFRLGNVLRISDISTHRTLGVFRPPFRELNYATQDALTQAMAGPDGNVILVVTEVRKGTEFEPASQRITAIRPNGR